MPFLLLPVEGGGGGVAGHMSFCVPSRNSPSSFEDNDTLLDDIPSPLPVTISFLASKVKFASPFLFIPTSYVFQ